MVVVISGQGISAAGVGSDDGDSAFAVLAEAGEGVDVGDTGDVSSDEGVFGVQI